MKNKLSKLISAVSLSVITALLTVVHCLALDTTTAATGDINRTLVVVLGIVMAVAVVIIIVLSLTKKK